MPNYHTHYVVQIGLNWQRSAIPCYHTQLYLYLNILWQSSLSDIKNDIKYIDFYLGPVVRLYWTTSVYFGKGFQHESMIKKFIILCWDRVSLHICCPWTQNGDEFTEICLSLLPRYWNTGCVPNHTIIILLFIYLCLFVFMWFFMCVSCAHVSGFGWKYQRTLLGVFLLQLACLRQGHYVARPHK